MPTPLPEINYNQDGSGAQSHFVPGGEPEELRAQLSESSRRLVAPETDAYGAVIARVHGRDDMSIWGPRANPIGPWNGTSTREHIPQHFNAEVWPETRPFSSRPRRGPEPTLALGAGKQRQFKSNDPSWWSFSKSAPGQDDELEEDELAMRSTTDEAVLHDIYEQHLALREAPQVESGVTLMLRDIPYRLRVEPELLHILQQTCELDHVDYIYLPMTIDGFSARSNVQSRNKGYCFIHFSVAETAHSFASQILEYAVPETLGGKCMFTAPAKFQGLGMNLINLLDIHSKKWRPKNGFAHIRTSKGDLACVGLLQLRNLVKRRAVRPPISANAY